MPSLTGTGPHPGLVVIHEASGSNDNIRDICRRFAEQGYAALGVDLFGGRNRVVCRARMFVGAMAGSPITGPPPGHERRSADLCPVVGSWPDKDLTTKAAAILETELSAAGIPHDLKVHPGTKHAFVNDTLRNYHADAAADSWRRVLAFFAEHVKASP